MYRLVIATLIITLIAIGCSTGGSVPSSPDLSIMETAPGRSHTLWGLWQGIINPGAGTIEFINLRTGDFHLNALPFLEPPALLNLTLESLEFNGDIIEADIGLRHPFLGLTEFTGFDVCGIFISNGSIAGFNDSGLLMAGDGDTRLLNPDGYSRWWNPAEFPMDGTIFGYTDGLLGAPDSHADFNSTLNGYKYFCDDLDDPDDPLTEVTTTNRGMFSAGQKNVRHYTIRMGDGLVFNYAIDACWQFPQGDSPWNAPDDFGPNANRTEAWRISATEIENTLWNDGTDSGGELTLQIDVYDWFDADMNSIRIESPGNFTMVESGIAIDGGDGYSTYQVEILSATPSLDAIDLLISIISEEADFQGFIPGTDTTAYFIHTSPVAGESPAGLVLVLDDIQVIFDQDWEEYSPCIITRPSGDVYIGYWRIYYIDPPHGHTTYAYSTNSGLSWIDSDWWMVGTNVMCDANIMTLDGLGEAYFLSGGLTPHNWWAGLNKCMSGNASEDFGFSIVGSNHGNAVIFNYDGYPIGFGDINDQINYKKGTMQNHPWSMGEWTGWSSTPEYNAVPAPALLSQTRNIVRDSSNAIYFTYFSSVTTDAWIRIAYNSDGDGLDWNHGDVVYDGSADGYDHAHDPGLLLDSNGVFHSTFILDDSSPGITQGIAYTSSDDGLSWSSPVIAHEVSGTDLLYDPTVDILDVDGQEILIINFRDGDDIYLTYSLDRGLSWETATLLGTGDDIHPDVCLSPDGYIHNVWEHDEGDDRRIEYRRAYFVEG